jgi:hypothetical protein
VGQWDRPQSLSPDRVIALLSTYPPLDSWLGCVCCILAVSGSFFILFDSLTHLTHLIGLSSW